MRSPVSFKLILVVCCLLAPLYASAVDYPHDPSNGITCSNCHATHSTLGSAGYVNICLSCHRPGFPKSGNRPLTIADAASPYGNFSGGRAGVAYQTSHNWTGPDTNLKAGALPPLNPALNTVGGAPLKTAGSIACSRCHNPHGNVNRPFLRIANDRDQLCLDCHRLRNTTNHAAGTHPVNFNYTGASSLVKRKPTEFNNPPRNSNPANPTSAMKLKGGTVLCTTCHGVHYTDSNSATFDNHSGFNALTPSAGYLLRTDLRGATATAQNICANCHVKPSHNRKGQNVQCADCHGGHVDQADGAAPNVWLVRRYMNVSTSSGAVRNKVVHFQSTSAKSYVNAGGTGVCQACHAIPTGGAYPPEHSLTNAPASVCNTCHAHGNSQGAFSASATGCTSCHGYPPRVNVPGGPNGYAGNYGPQTGVSEASSPHWTHAGGGTEYAYGCAECHKGNSHMTGGYQDVFIDKAGIIAATAGAVPAYSTGGRSCSSVYCHSDGAPRNASLAPVMAAKTIPAWPNGAGKITGCASCHAAAPATNVHTAHINKGYGCVVCHAATVSDNTTISDKTRHADGVKTVAFSAATPLATGTVWNNATAGCSTSKCHSNGVAGNSGAPVTTPVWVNAATGKCGACHYVTPAIAATSAQTIASNAHGKHLTTAYGPGAYLGSTLSACQACHDYSSTQPNAKHVNGVVEVLSAAGSACVKCHPGAVPSWTSPAKLACDSCHGATPAVLANGVAAQNVARFTTSGHGQPAANYNSSRACESCHDANSAHISGVLGDTKRLLLANDNSQCASCHNDAAKVPTATRRNMASHVTAKGGAATSDCKLCHDPHGTTNLSMIKTIINGKTISFTNLSSGFIKRVAPFDGLCQACHTQTAHFRSGQALDGHPTKNCLYCHGHNGAYAFQPASGGTCDSCHGYPPAPAGFAGSAGNYANAKPENYLGGGGAHIIGLHVKKTAVPSEGWANCTMCHGNGSLNPVTHTMALPVTPSKITIDLSDKFKFNHTLPLGAGQYNGKLLDGGANATGSCLNAKCHFKPSKKWSTAK